MFSEEMGNVIYLAEFIKEVLEIFQHILRLNLIYNKIRVIEK